MTQTVPNADARPDAADAVPLCVDLDGTLLYTDTLTEAIIKLLRQQPFYLLMLPIWLWHGRAFLKQQVARRVTLNVAMLPYRPDVLEYVWQQKRAGRRVILATATDRAIAQPVADHLQLFDEVIASDGRHNRRSSEKVNAIRQVIGEGPFDYIGDSRQDLSVWKAARGTLIVEPDAMLLQRARAIREPEKIFGVHPSGSKLSAMHQALRPRQWLKNLLLFVPLAMAHQLDDSSLRWSALMAFIAFSLCASAVYIFNDLFDLEADRLHPIKRNRPFASGRLTVAHGLMLAALLLPGAFLLAAATLPASFVGLLAVYLLLTFAYTLVLKRKVLLDAIVLAGLYTLRIMAGGEAVGIAPTAWLIEFSMFLFLSLAFAKRYAELLRLKSEDADASATVQPRTAAATADPTSTDITTAPGRSYRIVDLDVVGYLGMTSGYLWVLVYVLYLNMSLEPQRHYENPEALWLISPIFLYWISRLWLLARRGILHEDPLLFTLTDRASHVCGLATLLLIFIAGP